METKLNGSFRKDLMASFVVFLVALPLCLGIAIASGMAPEKGLLSGAIGGILVGFFGGAPLQVSGPANGLIVVVGEAIKEQGLAALSLAVFLAGLVQLIAGWAKVGQFFRAVSPGVILGLMAGFALMIFSSQSYVLINLKPDGSTLFSLANLPLRAWSQLVGEHSQLVQTNLLLGVVTLLTVVAWNKWTPKALKFIPAYLVAVVVVTGLSFVISTPVARVAVPSDLGGVLSGGFSEGIRSWNLGMLQFGVLELAFVIALIASAETLLSATATDQLHSGPRTKYNRELCAQGVGNMLCGILCVPPITGVIIRSTANVTAGAETRYSTIFHGLWLLLLVGIGASMLSLIPLVALAAVLIHAVTRLVKIESIKQLRKYDSFGLIVFAATVLFVISFSALWGVLIGTSLALLRLVHRVAALKVEVVKDETSQDKFSIALVGPASFVRVPLIAEALEAIPRGAHVSFDFEKSVYIDQACAELLKSWAAQHKITGGQVKLDEQKVNQLTFPSWTRNPIEVKDEQRGLTPQTALSH